ncbi:MAG: major facilitator superfamily 1 [Pelosinus sp.]|jgi:MFS family permease|nr:major facilitator superfamily 1 [Pelosinus sp.]
MITLCKTWLRETDRNYLLFLLASIFLGIGQSVDGATLTNYLKENFQMLIVQRSALEFPRELPGLLVVLVIGSLYSLGDIKIAVVANLLAALGMFSLGLIPPEYSFLVVAIFIYSMGQHIYMPLSNSIGMSFATSKEFGKKLGQLSAANTAALVISSAVLWALFKFLHISYTTSFSIGAVSFIIAALLLSKIKSTQTVKGTTRFIFRKEYGLYYWLCILFGARKQIFITFGPWVLVDVFKEDVSTMALLFFIISVMGIFVKPFIGHLIDKVGEKFLLNSEAVLFFFVCLGYAFAEDLFRPTYALLCANACYILDQTLSSISMARATYLRKIAVIQSDVSPTLSLGTSIDHIVTMFLPIIGGLVWYNNGSQGYKYVFLGGAVIAVINFISTSFIKIKQVDPT